MAAAGTLTLSLDDLLKLGEFAESFFTVLGIIAAGWWAWHHYTIRRERYPRAAVSHSTHSTQLSDGRSILRVVAKLTNIGNVVVRLRYARTFVQKFVPVPSEIEQLVATDAPEHQMDADCELPWPLIGQMREWNIEARTGEVEPGESEVFCSDFVVPADVQKVLIYSFVSNSTKAIGAEIGWSENIVVSLKTEQKDG